MARLFFAGSLDRAGNALGRLQRKGLVQIQQDALAGNFSYYQLTRQACASVGVPVVRAEPLKGFPLARALGVLWFSTMSGARRALLTTEKLPPEYPVAPGKAPHVGEILPSGQGRIYRVQVADPQKDHIYPFSQIQKAMLKMTEHKESAAFVSSGLYAFAVLVTETEKLARFEEALVRYRAKFTPGSVVLIETVPSPANLDHFAKDAL